MNDSVSRWKTKHKQNLNPNVAAATEYMWVRAWNPPGHAPIGLQHDTRAISPKEVTQHPDRFWSSTCFINCRPLRTAMDMNPVELESV